MPYCYPLFVPETRVVFVGSEVRAHLFGTALAEYSRWDVHFAVFDHRQPSPERHGAVTVHGVDWKVRAPRIVARAREFAERAFTRVGAPVPNWLPGGRPLWRALRAISVDTFIAFGASEDSANLFDFARRRGKRSVLFCGSDEDLSLMHREGNFERNPYGTSGHDCWRALMGADIVLLQNDWQCRILEERFFRRGHVVPSPVDISDSEDLPGYEDRDLILWIGKSDKVKCPDVAVQLAEQRPNLQFLMLMNRSEPDVWSAIERTCPKNVELIEWLPFAETDALFRRARAILNTSRFEGFPNTFLQAGKHGCPILSLSVDPDSFIANGDCGIAAAGDLNRLKSGLDALDDRETWSRQAANCRRYVERHHGLDRCTALLEKALKC
jgi:glycosyltransferase involved in cell wall biosynthesis